MLRILVRVAAVGILLVAACWAAFSPRRGPEVAVVAADSGAFGLRVRVRAERSLIPGPAGSYYAFEANPAGAPAWRRAMEFRHDDSYEPGHQQWTWRFLGDRTAFVYMGWKYAVTTDGGRRWAVWDAADDLPGWSASWCTNYRLIGGVELAPDGTGRMRLDLIGAPPGVGSELRTEDFGRHWRRLDADPTSPMCRHHYD